MGRVGNQIAVGIKQRAAEVEPLLDVHRVAHVLEGDAHLLGNRHEQVVENLQGHRVHLYIYKKRGGGAYNRIR